MTSPEARAAEVIDHIGDEPSNVIAAALAPEGLLTPEPQIIRTRDELAALDPDTMLVSTVETQSAFTAEEPQEMAARGRKIGTGWLPAVVIATGDQVRAARQALEATE